MTALPKFINQMRSVPSRIAANLKVALYEESKLILSDFQARSPVDTGLYRTNWSLRTGRFSGVKTLASISIANATPYAGLMEYGGGVNEAPWYYPSSGSKTGRLTQSGGRIWAGGRSPGHSNTVGGAIGPALLDNESRLVSLTKRIASGVVEGFK